MHPPPFWQQMWLYNCGSQSCSTTTASGALMFGKGGPSCNGAQTWPLAVGSYTLVMLKNDGYSVLVGPLSFSVTN